MNKQFLKTKKFKVIAIIVAVSIALIGFITCITLTSQKTKDNDTVSVSKEFDSFVNDVFKEMVTMDTLTLQYTLDNPSDYGINKIPITFGNIPMAKNDPYFTTARKHLSSLEDFEYKKLNTDRQYVYDTLYWYFTNISKSQKYIYHGEYLSPSSGVQIQLPILLCEYDFNQKKDIDNYLKLLKDIERYFDDICKYEEKKAQKGLFMSKTNASKVLEQCKNIMINISTSLYVTEFNKKIEEMKDISQNEIYDYQTKNEDIVLSCVLDAYTNLYSTISKLNKNNTNNGTMSSLDNGKSYYEFYVQEITGSNRTIKNIISILENTVTQQNNALLSFVSKNKDINTTSLNKNYGSNDSDVIITTLQKQMQKEFPTVKNYPYEIKDVPSQLEDNMGPAFYVISPIDNTKQNVIYINKGAQYLDNPLFTNLSHEAFPGHLYQNCYFNSANKYPIRSLIKNLGYVEGWASYVTLVSYKYSELDNYYANLYKYNNAIVLCLSARADIGVHYENWDQDDIKEYFNKNSCPIGDDAIQQLYDIIIEEPGDYLPYAVGYIEISRMLEDAKEKSGDDFNLKDFHTALLEAGPAPFSSIKSHIKY